MRKKTVRRIGLSAIAVLILAGGVCSNSFAEGKEIPVKMTVPATAIDVVMTETITMSAGEGDVNMTISPLEIQNKSKVGIVTLSEVSIDTKDSGWEVVADTSDFAKMQADSKKFSVVAGGTHDFSTGSYTKGVEVEPEGTNSLAFTGKTGLVTSAVAGQQVASFVCTLAYK
ncbi:hypothetical protein NE619_00500 [Anaerovorax odorimutans]|uniref:WxL domain-containing protein n=1 Tax=Anaerovorax odorimutans TaxID=109327 RepID=A0ABT1RJ49_9FIRM|nr:hypothetical protein [Anaerovorax odorimutans]MCQ4635212.1 hypothetical protein [Anaerovorax odorimutans]